MRKLVYAGFVGVTLTGLPAAANANNGFSGGALPFRNWVELTLAECYVQPYQDNRVLGVFFPNPWTPGKFLWSTDDATIGALSQACSSQKYSVWFYQGDGVHWIMDTVSQAPNP